jgi:formylglycine-generating enzyme required for sulfatase activity
MTKDPVQEVKGESSYRVLRGGSWRYNASLLVASSRYYNSPSYRYFSLGLRSVRNTKENE